MLALQRQRVLDRTPVVEVTRRQVRPVMSAALSAAQLSTASRGRNTRFLTYFTPVSTEPFSQPFAGAQNSARNGYAPVSYTHLTLPTKRIV